MSVRITRICWIISVFLACFNLALFFQGRAIMLLYVNAMGGCFPWSPREVEYHDHMTLCPGQRTVIRIELQAPGREI